ncbi:primosomal protein N' [Microbacterium sp. LRZ72]|nr:primosomal protein N' [Microbacterium sp. LRZ72]
MARVLLDSPLPQLDRLLDYAIPPSLADQVEPGIRIRVPLRTAGRIIDAFVIEIGEAVDPDRPLSEIDAVVSAARIVPPHLYELARRTADRAAGSAADILRLAIPRRLVRVEKTWLARESAPEPVVAPEAQDWARRALAGFPGLAEAVGEGSRLAIDAPPRAERAFSGASTAAWAALFAAAAALTLAEGRSAVLVVPDHRDLEQLARALAGLLPADAVVSDHSDRPAGERYRDFLRTVEERPVVVLGNRSAIYAPVHRLGLIALWDDGDPLLSEPLAPYVHARDAALVRQGLEQVALVFAGHTRTTDVQRLVEIGWVREVAAHRRPTPRIVLSATQGDAAPARISSGAFAAARTALESSPVLVQVARPGYSPVLVCASCRRAARCRHCAGPLQAESRGSVPSCRWCGRSAPVWSCGHCEGTALRLASSGSSRTADELGRAFPGVRVILSDGTHAVAEVADEPALVVATRGAEPVAANGYGAVLLLDGERMLMADSLRIGEDCLRWWSNAAALAAPGAPVHLVGVAGAVARALATWTQAVYARAELADRAPLHLPPTARVAAIEGEAGAVERALDELRAAVELAEDAVVGPVEAMLGPRRGEEGVRALVLFDYASGPRVTASLRASVVQTAVRGRRSARGARPRNTLRVRVDVIDPAL